MRLLFVLSALTLTVAASAAAAPDPVRATMSTSATKPLADTPWRYTVVVKDRAGRPLAARMRLQALRGSKVVRCWKGTAMTSCSRAEHGTWIAFTGTRTGLIRWPARSAGVKLTFQAIVVAGTEALRLRAPLTIRLP